MTTLTDKQLAKLREIGAVPEGSYFAAPIAVNALTKLGMVEVHPTLTNPTNAKERAVRLSDAGKAAITSQAPTPPPSPWAPNGPATPPPAFAAAADEAGDDDEGTTVDDFLIIEIERPAQGRTIGSTQYKYPFDRLDNGKAFFVPSKEGVKSPAKAFASTVATANKRFNQQSDFRRFSTRSMDGAPFKKPGVRGVGVFRLSAEEELEAKKEAGWKV